MNDFESVNPVPVQINIGSFYMFIEYIKIAGFSVINEQSNISGGTSVTNRSIRNTSVTLSGRLACDSDFKNFVIYAENILRNKTPLSFQYKNISFSSGVLKSYSAESKNLSVTDIKLVFSVPQISEVVQNGN